MKPSPEQLEQLSAYLDGELPPPQRAMVERMLAGDAELRRDLEAMRRAVEAVRALPRERAPAGLAAGVAVRVGQSAFRERVAAAAAVAPQPGPHWGERVVQLRRYAVAAVILLAAGVGSWAFLGRQAAVRAPAPTGMTAALRKEAPGSLGETAGSGGGLGSELKFGAPPMQPAPVPPLGGIQLARKDERMDLGVAQVAGARQELDNRAGGSAGGDAAMKSLRTGTQSGSAPEESRHARSKPDVSGPARGATTDAMYSLIKRDVSLATAQAPHGLPVESTVRTAESTRPSGLRLRLSSDDIEVLEHVVTDLERRRIASATLSYSTSRPQRSMELRRIEDHYVFSGSTSEFREIVAAWQDYVQLIPKVDEIMLAQRHKGRASAADLRIEYEYPWPDSIMSASAEEWAARVARANASHQIAARSNWNSVQSATQATDSSSANDTNRVVPVSSESARTRTELPSEISELEIELYLLPSTTTATSTSPSTGARPNGR